MTDPRPSENGERPLFPMAKHLGLIPNSTQKEQIAHTGHAERARNLLMTAESHAFAGEQDRLVAKAHVHATLALVEQQRLANLIAWQLGTAENYEREIREGLTR